MNEMDTSIFPLFSVLLIMKIAAITCDKNTLYHSSTEVPHNWTGLDSSHLSITRDQPATSTTVSLHILSKRLLTDLTQSTILVTSNSSNTEINSTDKPVPALLMSTGKTRSSLNDLTMMSDSALLNARIIEASHVLATSSSSVKVKAFVAVTASVLETYTLTKNSSINTASLKTAYSSVNARSNITATSSVNGISNIAATVYVNATPFLTPTPSVHSTSSQVTAYSANTTSSITTTVSANETSSIAATFPTNETSSIASLPANARSSITTTFPENATASITATSPVLATSSITAASSVNVISSITTSFPANATSSITPTSSAKHASSIAATATLYAPFSITSIVSILTTTPSSATVTTFIKITTSTSVIATSSVDATSSLTVSPASSTHANAANTSISSASPLFKSLTERMHSTALAATSMMRLSSTNVKANTILTTLSPYRSVGSIVKMSISNLYITLIFFFFLLHYRVFYKLFIGISLERHRIVCSGSDMFLSVVVIKKKKLLSLNTM